MAQKRTAPTVKRRRVGSHVRAWREAAGLKSGNAALKLGWGQPRLSRIERGVYALDEENVRHLASAYGVHNEEEIAAVVEAAEAPPGEGWWHPYEGRISPEHLDYIELEASAETIRMQHNTIIPGLLQTPAYAREILSFRKKDRLHNRDAPNIDTLIAVRLSRQDVLTRGHALKKFEVLVPEHALHAEFEASDVVLRDQVRKLIEVSEAPNVDLRLVPLSSHPSAGSTGSITLFSYPAPWAPVASVETPTGGDHTEEAERFALMEWVYEGVAQQALSAEATREELNKYLKV